MMKMLKPLKNSKVKNSKNNNLNPYTLGCHNTREHLLANAEKHAWTRGIYIRLYHN
uniref:Uncharacterized protein n=1 Tax=Octopus bimaculoides TaxID=37653 RepID=A0A0L8HU52_OCTBM